MAWVGCSDPAQVELENIVARGSSTVPTLSISPNGGVFVGSQEVTLTCSTLETTIRYTTDGTTPTATSSLYSPIDKFSITATTTVKAIAVKEGFPNSAVATAVFREKVATPVISPNGGDFIGIQEITVTCATPGARIKVDFGR